MKGALPMGVDANGDECVCYEFEVIPDVDKSCPAEPDYNIVEYDKCQMEKSMYRAIFLLSDVDGDK
jgi:hypothetical protein